MKIGCLINLFCDSPLNNVLSFCRSVGIEMVEIGCGGITGKQHCDPSVLLKDDAAFQAFKHTVERSGVGISAFSAHGNPIHPVKRIAERYDAELRNAILLAEKMGVDTVVTFSGIPGDADGVARPNWVTSVFPYDFMAVQEYQWRTQLIPYWRDLGAFAIAHNVTKIAFEMHPAFSVFNPETLLELRESCGEFIGANFDPSHLIWQGIDCPTAIHKLSDCIFHFHAKDTLIDQEEMGKNGFFSFGAYQRGEKRAFEFKIPTYGTGDLYWKQMISALHDIGYKNALSIEHEDLSFGQYEGIMRSIEILKGLLYLEEPENCAWKKPVKEYQKTFLPTIEEVAKR